MTRSDATRMMHDVALLFAFVEREAGARADGPRATRRSGGGAGRARPPGLARPAPPPSPHGRYLSSTAE